MTPRRPSPLLLVLLAVVVAACAGSGAVAAVRTPVPLPPLPTPTGVPPPTATPVPTPTPLPTPTPVEIDGDLLTPEPTASFVVPMCDDGIGTLCVLKPGEHASDPFVPAFTYRLPKGGDPWVAVRQWPDGGQISRGSAALWWATGFSAGTQAYLLVDIGPGVQDVVNHLRRYQGRTVGESKPATVGGEPGIVFDFRTNDLAIPRAFLLANDGIDLTAGEIDRIYVVEHAGQRVMFVLQAVPLAGESDVDADQVFEELQPILDSIQWQ